MAALEAEVRDDQVDRLAHRYAARAQGAIVPRRAHCEVVVEQRYDRELAEVALDARRMGLVTRALQDLQEDQVADEDLVGRVDCPELARSRRVAVAQVRDPCRAIDEDHYDS
jgi:hypothetical protein